jgi:hypothetical protein
MTTTSTRLRRTALITLMSLAAAAAFAWWRQRNEMAMPAEPAQWPPFVAPESWVIATSDGGTAPEGFPVKVKVSSGIFHVPGGRFYDRTNPDRWYATADAAQADGYRQSKT